MLRTKFTSFMKKGVVPFEKINVSGLGDLLFHEIVLEEAKAHEKAFKELKKLKLPSTDVPDFFSKIKGSDLKEMMKFIQANIDKSTKKEQPHNQHFRKMKKAYEKERKDLQKAWTAQGIKANKVSSKPSNNDYNLLYSANHRKYKLVTHDEILFSVASEFLEEGFILRTEDILNQILKINPSLKIKIEDATNNLESIGEKINI